MHSLFEKKPLIAILSLLALGAVVLLASGLGRVPFHAAQPFIRNSPERGAFSAGSLLESWREIPLYMQVGVWVAVIMLVALIGALLSPENRKRLLRAILRIAVTYWLLYFLITEYGDQLAITAFNFLSPNSPPPVPGANTPPVFTPTVSMVWISYGVSLLIVLGAALLTWRSYLFWAKLKKRGGSLNQIADIARASLRDLSSGRDSTDVIMNCYYRMSDAVADKRDLQRKDSMTPSEFAVRLEQAGLPGEAVRRLTALFEAVRYGDRRSSQREVNEAVACLNSILIHCGEPV
jgi:hypothetical protein